MSPPRIRRQRALVVGDKAERVVSFHRATHKALAEAVAAVGIDDPSQLMPLHISRRVAADRIETYAEIYPALAPGALVTGSADPRFVTPWRFASEETFQPNANLAYVANYANASTEAAG